MNPFCHRELNGELRPDWHRARPDPVVHHELVPMMQRVSRGGPFEHKLSEAGICTVCGYWTSGGMEEGLGCPWQVNMATLKDIKRPAVPGQVEAAAAAIRAIWAAEKARMEEAQ